MGIIFLRKAVVLLNYFIKYDKIEGGVICNVKRNYQAKQ